MNTQPTDRQRAELHAKDDSDILNAKAHHAYGDLAYIRRHQDGRTYYAMTVAGRQSGILTTAVHARQTIAYWTSKGLTV